MASTLAKEVLRGGLRSNRAVTIGLVGNLGSGKTTFAQGFARGLGVGRRITSPTFLMVRNFPCARGKRFFHIDAYRIHKPSKARSLGLTDIVADSRHIILVEWANRIQTLLPRQMLWVQFLISAHEHRRTIQFMARPPR